MALVGGLKTQLGMCSFLANRGQTYHYFMYMASPVHSGSSLLAWVKQHQLYLPSHWQIQLAKSFDSKPTEDLVIHVKLCLLLSLSPCHCTSVPGVSNQWTTENKIKQTNEQQTPPSFREIYYPPTTYQSDGQIHQKPQVTHRQVPE